MLNSFIKLYKKVYENKENIVIDSLGIKIDENLSAETITSLLFQLCPRNGIQPIVSTNGEANEVEEHDEEIKVFNKKRVLNAYYLIRKIRRKRIYRALLYGTDKDKVYEKIKDDFVYEDDEIKTVFIKDEIYFSLYIQKQVELKEIIKNYNVNLFIYEDYKFIHQMELTINASEKENREYRGRRFNNNMDSVGLYLTIANSSNYLAHEIIAAEVFDELNNEELVLKLIDNINSRFVSSYILKPIMIRQRFRKSRRNDLVIPQILKNIKLEDVLHIDIHQAYKMFKK